MAAELYVIEKVVKKRVLKSGKVQDLVKWKVRVRFEIRTGSFFVVLACH